MGIKAQRTASQVAASQAAASQASSSQAAASQAAASQASVSLSVIEISRLPENKHFACAELKDCCVANDVCVCMCVDNVAVCPCRDLERRDLRLGLDPVLFIQSLRAFFTQ